MAIISIFSGSFCYGDKIVEGVTKNLGYKRIDDDIYQIAESRFNLSKDKLKRAIYGTPSFFGKLSNDRRKAIAYLRIALSEILEKDGLLLHGYESHLIPQDISHILRVCVIANLDYRIDVAGKTDNLTIKEATSKIHSEDEQNKDWCHFVRQHDPYDESLYDMLLAMQSMNVDKAVETICEAARSNALTVTPESVKSVNDFKIAAQAQLLLVDKGFDVDVTAKDGAVHVDINKYTSRLDQQKSKINELVSTIDGVVSVKSAPGTRFTPPSLLREPHFDMPTKILLVDDEKEFVHTLSERLENRNLNTSIVYNGEEALDFISNDEPEVMILDLKMPGIDGIEVLRQVKRNHANIEVIILTGHGSDKEQEIANELGAFAYLQKPVNIDLLAKTMKEAYQKIGKDMNNKQEQD